ncbi:MAG: hypothetical protein LBS21_13815 [Clostridiales bacterium]|jgi:hypothetical protein|nr:hypothetical protein [Clostridiales bacterium]
MESKVSKQVKDLIQKYTSNLFKDATLEFYGIKTAKIKELINVELPEVTVKAYGMDIVFLLEDNAYLHFEFQSTYNHCCQLNETTKQRIVSPERTSFFLVFF